MVKGNCVVINDNNFERSTELLRYYQRLPLNIKVSMTKLRISDFVRHYGENGVCISFSGGKDSTVLMDLVRNKCGYRNVRAVFADIPTQFPELRKFVKTFENVDIITPEMGFIEVCERYGFPIFSKEVSSAVYYAKKKMKNCGSLRGFYAKKFNTTTGFYDMTKYAFLLNAPFDINSYCCNVMKKRPLHKYQKANDVVSLIATMAEESLLRTRAWIRTGCNAFDGDNPHSTPMAFWTEQDVLQYIAENNLKICSVYGDIVSVSNQVAFEGFEDKPKLTTTGYERTGCVLCGFGCHLEKNPNRFENLKITHSGMYSLLDKITNNGYTYRQAIEWINENGNMHICL